MIITDDDYGTAIRRFRVALGIAVGTLGVGTVVYHYLEKLNWVDAIYFSVITLATVGYGDIVPKTTAGKLFTVFYVLVGIAIIATFANLALKRAVTGYMYKRESPAKQPSARGRGRSGRK